MVEPAAFSRPRPARLNPGGGVRVTEVPLIATASWERAAPPKTASTAAAAINADRRMTPVVCPRDSIANHLLR
jgi:hypothetical protein